MRAAEPGLSPSGCDRLEITNKGHRAFTRAALTLPMARELRGVSICSWALFVNEEVEVNKRQVQIRSEYPIRFGTKNFELRLKVMWTEKQLKEQRTRREEQRELISQSNQNTEVVYAFTVVDYCGLSRRLGYG
jgi:hypothetical protein